MGDLLRSSLRITWVRNGAYLGRLVDDLGEAVARWIAQPASACAMNHPAWIVCHLRLYRRVILDLLRGAAFDDPLDAPFGRGSKVSMEPAAHPAPREMRETIERLGADVLAALDAAPTARFEAPNPLPRWRELHPRVGEQLVTLMVKHESFHLGQLSAWRRAMGLPSVAM
ncbi:MAG: DinB family protein [Phycisphaerae bacterium]|nr:DinB family protein [Phycisphaerae bacterium]